MRREFTKKTNIRGSEKLDDKEYLEITKSRLDESYQVNNECWEWKGYIGKSGYGSTTYRSKSILAHRLSWMIYKGDLPKDLDVCHTCDNRKCINPSHLFLGTAHDNILDCFLKKRKSHMGEKHPRAKMTENNVVNIFDLRRKGWTHQEIADKFNIKQGTVSNILHRRLWPHVNV